MAALAVLTPAQHAGAGQANAANCGKVERIKPNLVLEEDVQLGGRIRDQSGMPLKGSVVELRLYENELKQTFVRQTTTDENGYFSLGLVPKGSYRLLASPTRAFKQPDGLECGNGAECRLPIELEANVGAERDSLCPVR